MIATPRMRVLASAAIVTVLAAGCTGSADDQPAGSTSQTAAPAAVDLTVVAARAGHAASSLPDGRVLVTGGCVVDGCSTATNETFLVSADGGSATPGPAMSVGRVTHTAVVLRDGRVVLHGGFPGEGQGVVASVDVVNPATGTVERQQQLGLARGGHTAVRLRDGRVLVAGGWIRPRTYTSTVEVFDPDTGESRRAADLPYGADALDGVLLADGSVLVVGGQVASGRATGMAAVFDPASASWSVVGPMRVPRLKHFSTLLPDGRVLVMGGTSDDRTILLSTESFDPVSRTFRPGPDLTEPRYKFAGGAVVLDDGRVLVAGGGGNVEVIDVAANTSRVVSRSTGQHSFATLNRLGNGNLLVLGGYDDRIRLRRDFQLISPDTLR